MSKYWIISIVFILFIISCNRKQVEFSKLSEITFKYPEGDKRHRYCEQLEIRDDTAYYSFIDVQKGVKYLFNLESFQTDTVDFLLSANLNSTHRIYINYDSVFVVYDDQSNQLVRQIGDSVDYYQIPKNNNLSTSVDNHIYLTEKYIIASCINMELFNNDLNTVDSFYNYFNEHQPISLIKKDEIIQVGSFPDRYKKGQVQDNLDPFFVYRENFNDLIVSFTYCDSVLQIDLETLQETWLPLDNPFKCKLKGLNNDQTLSRSYNNKAFVKYPKFIGSHYNLKTELYFRQFYPGFNDTVEYLPDAFDLTFYYLVYDKHLNHIETIPIIGEKYIRHVFISTDNFIYLKSKKSNEKEFTIDKFSI